MVSAETCDQNTLENALQFKYEISLLQVQKTYN